MFPEADIVSNEPERMVTPNLDDFKVSELNWLTVGRFITSLYNHLTETKQTIIFIITVDDMLKVKVEEESQNGHVEKPEDIEMKAEGDGVESGVVEPAENTNEDSTVFIAPSSEPPSGQTSQPDSNAEDSDNTSKEAESAKPKPRRRCSDLSFLEQWGWHKNRRYSSRKKSQQDRPEVDTSINGFLRRILAKYFQ